MVSPHETMTEPSASLAILPVSMVIGCGADLGRDLVLHLAFLDCASSRPVTLIVGFNSANRRRRTKLKPKLKVHCGLACRL